jgi:hypothetical protein
MEDACKIIVNARMWTEMSLAQDTLIFESYLLLRYSAAEVEGLYSLRLQ